MMGIIYAELVRDICVCVCGVSEGKELWVAMAFYILLYFPKSVHDEGGGKGKRGKKNGVWRKWNLIHTVWMPTGSWGPLLSVMDDWTQRQGGRHRQADMHTKKKKRKKRKKFGTVLWTYGKPKDKSKIMYQLSSGNSHVHSKIFIRNSVLGTTTAATQQCPLFD